MSRKQQKPGGNPPADVAEVIEMLDGRVFWSDDNWQTIWARSRDGKRWRRVPEKACDIVRYLAIAQSTGSASF